MFWYSAVMDLLATTFTSLEWGEFLRFYSGFCYSTPAQEQALALEIPDDQVESERRLRLTLEGTRILELRNFSYLSSLPNLDGAFQRLAKGFCLSGQELAGFQLSILCSMSSQEAFRTKGVPEKAPEWRHFLAGLNDFRSLAEEISVAISPEGEVKDSASTRLSKLRREERKLHDDAKRESERLVKQAYKDGFAQDTFFDVRDGRYVIPVKREARGQIQGIAYESSASKATIYLEPSGLRDSNDRIRQVQVEIEEEIYAILRALSDRLHPHATELWADYEALIQLDLGIGRARMAMDFAEYRHSSPFTFSESFELPAFYHPLLRRVIDRDKLVTSDFRLDPEEKALIISGPNTGGKTVYLKALGIGALMARAGFFLTAGEGAKLPYFTKVLAHIGDGQSISESLSSFSSSILALKLILEESNSSTLILIDEILSSTDPREASALSQAILRALADRGAVSVVTTHFSDLKELASESKAFKNASMEFDSAQMLPLYRLRIGIPGRSWAIETATRLGLAPEIIADATNNLGDEQVKIDKLLADIEVKGGEIDQERLDLAQAKDAVNRELVRLKEQRLNLSEERERIREHYQIEFRKAEREAEARVAAVIDEYREKISQAPVLAQEMRAAKRKIAELRKDFEPTKIEAPSPSASISFPIEETVTKAAPPKLEKGATVLIKNLRMKGLLLNSPGATEKQAEVQVGSLKIRAAWAQVEVLASSAPVITAAKKMRVNTPDRAFCAPELNLLGLRVDDAVPRLEEYLDLASQSSLPSVRIVHGHGTGALKRLVRETLKGSAYRFKFRSGSKDEGGDGCTVIELSDSNS